MKCIPLPLLLSALISLGSLSLSAATLVNYDFAGNGVPTPNSQPLSATNAAWTGFPPADAGFSAGTSSAFIRGTATSSSIVTSQYLSFQMEADEGMELDLASITIELGGTTINTTNLNAALQVRTSLDGFASSLLFSHNSAVEALHTVTAIGSSVTSYGFYSIDLSSLARMESITFRLYGYTPAPHNAGNFFRLGSVVVAGEVQAIPEPSTLLLLGGAALVALASRRSRLS